MCIMWPAFLTSANQNQVLSPFVMHSSLCTITALSSLCTTTTLRGSTCSLVNQLIAVSDDEEQRALHVANVYIWCTIVS